MFLISSCSCRALYLSQVLVKNEDLVGAAPAGDAPTTSEWSKNVLTAKVVLILGI